MLRIDQYVPCLSTADAVSGEVVHMRDLLRSWGYRSDIYTELSSKRALHVSNHDSSDVLIYHLAVGSSLPYEWAVKGRVKIVRYHNITPSHFFQKGSMEEYVCDRARWQLSFVEAASDFIWCDSKLNQKDFLKHSSVFSVLRRYEDLESSHFIDRSHLKHIDFLTVGHCRPHKGHKDLMQLCALWKMCFKQQIRMVWVGSWQMEDWSNELKQTANQLGLTLAESLSSEADIVYLQNITESELSSVYEHAAVYLSMSTHEGVGLPLLEAARFGLPILAAECEGVRETLEGLSEAYLLPQTDMCLWVKMMKYCIDEKLVSQSRILPERFQWDFLIQSFKKHIDESVFLFREISTNSKSLT
ncbi:MAG: glycosyltransferase [Oligoflexales bacterium]